MILFRIAASYSLKFIVDKITNQDISLIMLSKMPNSIGCNLYVSSVCMTLICGCKLSLNWNHFHTSCLIQ